MTCASALSRTRLISTIHIQFGDKEIIYNLQDGKLVNDENLNIRKSGKRNYKKHIPAPRPHKQRNYRKRARKEENDINFEDLGDNIDSTLDLLLEIDDIEYKSIFEQSYHEESEIYDGFLEISEIYD